mmetsp:Transcript_36500/g.59664  ORF Transcript_36500/g.59664 Transcript_36500/m.59664 type:complete len:144 (-) Transcript_36500:59-490(-)
MELRVSMRLKCKLCHTECSTETMRHSAMQCNTVPSNNDTWETNPRQWKLTEGPSWGEGEDCVQEPVGLQSPSNLLACTTTGNDTTLHDVTNHNNAEDTALSGLRVHTTPCAGVRVHKVVRGWGCCTCTGAEREVELGLGGEGG